MNQAATIAEKVRLLVPEPVVKAMGWLAIVLFILAIPTFLVTSNVRMAFPRRNIDLLAKRPLSNGVKAKTVTSCFQQYGSKSCSIERLFRLYKTWLETIG